MTRGLPVAFIGETFAVHFYYRVIPSLVMERNKYMAVEILIIESFKNSDWQVYGIRNLKIKKLSKNSDWQVNTNSIIAAQHFYYRVSVSLVMERKKYMAAEFFLLQEF